MPARPRPAAAPHLWRGWGILVAAAACHPGAATPTTPGTGEVSGSVDGVTFDHVGSSWLAGQPDDPSTTVVYLSDADLPCDTLGSPGWDARTADGSQVLELKLIGTEPGEYPVQARPSAGQSTDNYTLTSASPAETSATSGLVTLDGLEPENGASGSFDLTFPTGSLAGSFSTGWCATAREP